MLRVSLLPEVEVRITSKLLVNSTHKIDLFLVVAQAGKGFIDGATVNE